MPIDLYEKNVALALDFDGAITDRSLRSPKTVTANGNAAISTTQKKFGSHSCYFDGAGDFLTIPASADFNFGTGAFTIEMWVHSDLTQQGTLWDQYPTSGDDRILIYLNTNGSLSFFYGNGISISTVAGLLVSANTWTHLAFTRNDAGVLNVFVSGVMDAATVTKTGNLGATNDPYIGQRRGGTAPFKGYIDDLRVTKGIARYTKNFTPPLEVLGAGFPWSISGTVRDSLGNFARRLVRMIRRSDGQIANEGLSNPSTGAFSLGTQTPEKHAVVVHDSDAWITYLPFNGANDSTLFYEYGGKTVTPFGNAKISTAQSKFGGASALFDGAGDYLMIPAASDMDFGAGDFTIESWVRPAAIGATQLVVDLRPSAGAGGSGVAVIITTTGAVRAVAGDSVAAAWEVDITSSTTLSINVWHHIAFVRSGSTFKVFIDGVERASASSSVFVAGGATCYIGANLLTTNFLNGYIDDLRISKGVARYTANFTPPTQPHMTFGTDGDPLWGNVSALFRFNGSEGQTSFQSADGLYTLGNTQGTYNGYITTSDSKFGGSCLFLSASSQVGNLPASVANFGASDFTFEFWVKSLDNAQSCQILVANAATGNSTTISLQDTRIFITSPDGSSGISTPSNSLLVSMGWSHVAVTRSGASISIFINGNLVVSNSKSGAYTDQSSWRFGTSGTWKNIYLQDLRITKGVARYTANFTPPSAPHPLGPTSFTNQSANAVVYDMIQPV